MSRLSALLILPLCCTLCIPELWATNSYLSLARQRYTRITGTRLDACSLCHTTAPTLNGYGQDYRSRGRDFGAIEALDSDGDGFSNIAEINALTFPGTRTDLPQSVLHFPVTVSTADRATGFAVTNTGSSRATVVLSVYQNSGQPVASGSGVAGYRILDMAAHSQTANLATELFGGSLQLDGGWVRLASAQTGVTGFYLTFDNRLTTMDGSDAVALAVQSLIFPELADAEISLVNPSETQQATVDLSVVDALGRTQASANIQIPANGRYSRRLDTLFPSAPAAGYLKLRASAGIVASELFGPSGVSWSALNGLDAAGGSKSLYSPQFAAGGGTWKSALTVVNLESSPTTLTLSFVSDNGVELGKTASIDMASNGRIVVSDPAAFGLPAVPESLIEGYVRINSSATRVAGFAKFGDPEGSRFQTALPCVTQGKTNLLFSQVAQDDSWFTGVAVIDASGTGADVTVSVFKTDGTLAGSGTRRLEPNGRFSKLLTELVPGLPTLSKGYFTVQSTQPVLGFAVFGTNNLSVLSAVPPQ